MTQRAHAGDAVENAYCKLILSQHENGEGCSLDRRDRKRLRFGDEAQASTGASSPRRLGVERELECELTVDCGVGRIRQGASSGRRVCRALSSTRQALAGARSHTARLHATGRDRRAEDGGRR